MSTITSDQRPRPMRTTTAALASEWTKLWSVRSTWWCLAGSAVLMILFAPLLGGSLANSYRDAGERAVVPVGHAVVMAVNLVQFAVAALAMLTISTEYSTGSIRSTLQAIPSRGRMLFAKSGVLAPVMLVIGTVLAVIGCALAMPLLFEYGVFNIPDTVDTVVATGVYLALVSVFTIGIGAAIRSSVGTLTVVFIVLGALPGALQVTNSKFLHMLSEYLPTIAGMHYMDGDPQSYPTAVAFLIVVAWAAAAQLCGYLVLRRRDA